MRIKHKIIISNDYTEQIVIHLILSILGLSFIVGFSLIVFYLGGPFLAFLNYTFLGFLFEWKVFSRLDKTPNQYYDVVHEVK